MYFEIYLDSPSSLGTPLSPSSIFTRQFPFLVSFLSFRHIRKNIQVPLSCAAANATWRRGVTILNAMVHRCHKQPNKYMVRIVSPMVPMRVEKHAKRKIVARKECEVGYIRYSTIAKWGKSSATISNAPTFCQPWYQLRHKKSIPHTVHSKNSILPSFSLTNFKLMAMAA